MGDQSMQIGQILKDAGESIVRNAIPGGGLILDLVESFTGKPVDRNVKACDLLKDLPPDLLLKELDMEHETTRAMLNAPQITRPKIALGCFYIYAFTAIMIIGMWAYGVINHKPDLVRAVHEGWQFILVIIGLPVTLLTRYFGIIRTEHDSRLGIQSPSIISKLVNR